MSCLPSRGAVAAPSPGSLATTAHGSLTRWVIDSFVDHANDRNQVETALVPFSWAIACSSRKEGRRPATQREEAFACKAAGPGAWAAGGCRGFALPEAAQNGWRVGPASASPSLGRVPLAKPNAGRRSANPPTQRAEAPLKPGCESTALRHGEL